MTPCARAAAIASPNPRVCASRGGGAHGPEQFDAARRGEFHDPVTAGGQSEEPGCLDGRALRDR